MIVTAFAEGDRRTLKNLLSRDVYENFEAAIAAREQRGDTVESRFVAIDSAAIVGAEQVLRWLPKGTHDYTKFLTPEEISALVTRNGLKVVDKTGVVFHPLADEWRQSRDTGINYMVLAEKAAAYAESALPSLHPPAVIPGSPRDPSLLHSG